ncbi:MAG: hypothetical protein ABII71_02535 [Candidatus Micrarchaeota archaeon]
MKRLLLVLLVLVSLSLATEGDVSASFEQEVGGSVLEIVSSWQALAALAIIASIILVAIGYMIAVAFEMPDLQAWASTELSQVIANAILIVVLIGTIAFLDMLVMAMVNGSEVGGLHCDIGDPCLQEVVTSEYGYLHDSIVAAEEGAKNALANNMVAAGWMNRRAGISCITIYCVMLSFYMGLAPQYILDVDRYTIIYEYWVNILNSLHAQKFFIDQISFKLGPLILAAGIVARAFFFTRKAGGLLIAIAAGIMFFFPMMYVFDWMTLDMVIAGEKAVEDDIRGCPEECSVGPPLAYYHTSGGEAVLMATVNDIYMAFDPEDDASAIEISRGTMERAIGSNGSAGGQTVYSCYYGPFEDCPSQCRDLPYPHALSMCVELEVQEACAQLPIECKAVRTVPGAADDEEYLRCPVECKIVPPLNTNCDVDRCLESRFDCRVTNMQDLDYRPEVEGPSDKVRQCNLASECPASMDAFESCVYVIPQWGSCDEELCVNCPPQCRLENADPANLPEECFTDAYDAADPSTWEIVEQCANCPTTCEVDVDFIETLDIGNCTGCPMESRLLHHALPLEYIGGDCSPENCPTDVYNRAQIPMSSCEACLFSEEAYIFNPPVNSDCGSLCRPSDNVPSKSPGEYSEADEDGLIGKAEITAVSKYIIPAYLLPLFNIVATLVFIKGFSAMLGGDIEIPGLRRLF